MTRVSQERLCPVCRTSYEASVEKCPDDGRELLVVCPEEDSRVGEVIDDRFTLLGVLGRGGMGVVYRALQHSMRREVAVKLLEEDPKKDEENVNRFLREAREASQLSHPHVITLFDFGQTDGGELFLVMELIAGRSLAEEIEVRKRIGLERAVGITQQICDALAVAHNKQIVHRDLKPENILLLDDGLRGGDFVKVIDFGIAKTQPLEGEASITQSQAVYGTPLYMAPEQIVGAAIDGRADLYALGCLLYQMLSGRLPFRKKRVAEMLVAHLRDEPEPIGQLVPELPQRIERLVMSTLAKDPALRPGTAIELKTRLLDCMRARASRSGVRETSDSRRPTVPGPERAAGFPNRSESSLPPEHPTGLEATNITVQASTFVGRTEDVASLTILLGDENRLVTVHGPGGMGKTRLALELGRRVLPSFPEGGVWFCDLTESTSIEGICSDVSRVLHVPLISGDDPVFQVSHAIAARGRTLLILDNFEQVAEFAVETVGRWLQLAPEASFLITSRESLGLVEEQVYELEPLSLPGEELDGGPSEASELFVERARAARRNFKPDQDSDSVISQIVVELDGLPLAIELAAARMSILTPSQLLERLRSRFELLKSRRRDGPDRQATLRAAIDWSWDLLEDQEKRALAQLSVFHGGFTADAVEGVLALAADEDGEAPWTLDVVQTLGEKSLVRTMVSPEFSDELRLGLYESIREYAAQRLDELGERDATRDRHAHWFLETCGRWAEGVGGRESVRLRKKIALEMENLVVILNRELGLARSAAGEVRRRAAERALRAILILDPLLRVRGPFGSHLTWLNEAVDLAVEAGVDKAILTRGFAARGEVRRTRKRSTESGEDFERALELARQRGDKRAEGIALFGLANLSHGQARVEDSVSLFEQALAVQREAGDRGAVGNSLAALGAICIWLNRLDEAQAHLEEALRALREAGDARFEGFVLVGLGALHFERGDSGPARQYVDQAIGILDEAGELRFMGEALMYLAFLDWEAGEHRRAQQHIGRALILAREVGDLIFQARYQAIFSALCACIGSIGESHEGLLLAEELSREAGSPLVELTVSLLRGQLDVAMAVEATRAGDADSAADHLRRARERIAPAEEPGLPDENHPEGTPPPCEVCDEVRFVLRMLKSSLERHSG